MNKGVMSQHDSEFAETHFDRSVWLGCVSLLLPNCGNDGDLVSSLQN